jgi:ATP:ADP antiporter, AAA family
MQATPLDRFLRIFADVKDGEGISAVLLMVNIFLILTSYLMLKVVREPLILAGGGAEVKSYSAAGQAVLLLVLVPVYGSLASRYPRKRLINIVTIAFALCLPAFYLLARLGVPLGVVFFLWVGIFNMMIVAQFWSFANDVYTTDEGKRLFPIVAFGASGGAVAGSFLAGWLIEPIGVYQLMLVAAVVLLSSLVLTNVVDARERKRREGHLPPPDTTAEMPAATTSEMRVATTAEIRAASGDAQPIHKEGPFQLVYRNRYLLLIALMILVLNWVNSTGEYIVSSTVTQTAKAQAAIAGNPSEEVIIGQFYAGYTGVVNLAALLIQLFLVSRIVKYAGVRYAILIMPLIALSGYAILAFYPVLAVVRWAKTAENATDYSLQNTLRHMLFLPTTRDQKYKAKQAIDSFFVRAGDVLSAVLVFGGTTYLAMKPQGFAVFNIVLVVIWLVLAFHVGRRFHILTASKGSDALTP